MKHFGDITKLSGYDLPMVDVITGGSPCQDLSVAGKRAGLAGERSGLFMEQMRIVKEMREPDKASGRTAWAVRPRYMVWENVPGAFSSGQPKGSDFAAVIEEIIKVAETCADVCVCVPDGGWTKSGCYYAEDGSWSIAWRVHDAQFWGVPQRRKRIALVADFGGLSAPEVLFERKGLRGDSAESGEEGEGVAARTESGVGNASKCYGFDWQEGRQVGGAFYEECAKTVTATKPGAILKDDASRGNANMYSPSSYGCYIKGPGTLRASEGDSRYNPLGEISETVSAKYGTGGNNQPLVMCFQNTGQGWWNQSEIGATVRTPCGGDSTKANLVGSSDRRSGSIVRRLTPLECERLQGFPDGWTDIGEWVDTKGKRHKEADSPRYKALGNSIAMPFWEYLARRICAQYERPVTMGSLFDGIGGFPLAFERCGAKVVWASEIEEFCIAVTKKHFPEEAEE